MASGFDDMKRDYTTPVSAGYAPAPSKMAAVPYGANANDGPFRVTNQAQKRASAPGGATAIKSEDPEKSAFEKEFGSKWNRK